MARKREVRPGQPAALEEVMATPPGVADLVPRARSGRDAGRVLRVLALIAVAIGLAAITAAACVLSYASIHHLATMASVSPRLARLYPLIFDALLVLAGCSVLALRGAGLVSRVYSWLCLLVLLGALAGGGAVRAAAIKVPHRLAGILAAVIPWALVLIGFGLLLALLRLARIRRIAQQVAGPEPGHGAAPAESAQLVVLEKTTAPPGPAAEPAAIVPGFTRTAAAAGSGAPGVLPADARTGGSPEAPTAPQPAAHVPPAPVQPAPVQAAPVQAAPVQAAPVQAAAHEAAPDHPAHAAVRQADLQLKARVPRQPAGQQPQASPATARPAPFMPPVGPRPAAEAPDDPAAQPGEAARPGEAAGTGPAIPAGTSGSTKQTNPRPREAQPAGTGPTTDPVAPPDVTPTDVTPPAEPPASEATASEATANQPTASTSLNAAPVTDGEDAEPGAPPALRRPRSSPTPPED